MEEGNKKLIIKEIIVLKSSINGLEKVELLDIFEFIELTITHYEDQNTT